MKFNLIVSSLAIIGIIAILTGISPAFAADDYVNVTVNISSVAEITVLPTSFSWTAGNLGSITPGTDSAGQNITIKNTGSVNVSLIYLNASTVMDETPNPLISTVNASGYSSAGFIFVANSTNPAHYHAGRLEWNMSSLLAGEIVGATGTAFGHGWYRNASGNDFLWKALNGSANWCNSTDATFTIKNSPENSSSLSRNLGTDTTSCTYGAGNAQWGTFTCSAGPLSGSCVATYYDCSKIYIYKYNQASDYPTCDNDDYLYRGNIIPGTEASIKIFASVPKGTPAGDAKRGMLTIIAT